MRTPSDHLVKLDVGPAGQHGEDGQDDDDAEDGDYDAGRRDDHGVAPAASGLHPLVVGARTVRHYCKQSFHVEYGHIL